MYQTLITFQSMTAAQRALSACQKRDIPARLVRTPIQLSSRGCGHTLELQDQSYYRALLELQINRIPFSRVFRIKNGEYVEVTV